MTLSISPTIASITINGHTYDHEDWEENTPGVLGGLGNDIATKIGALENSLGILTKAISDGTTTLDGTESTNIGFVFTGALTGDATIVFAAGFSGPAQIENQTTGGKQLLCGLVAGTQVTVPALGGAASYCDGTNFTLDSGVVRTSAGAKVVGTLAVTGAATITGAATVTGAATFSSTAHVVGAATLDSTLAIGGAATVTGALSVTGASSLSTLVTSGNATIGGNDTVIGTHSVGGAQTVTGAASFGSTASVAGAVTVSGGTFKLSPASGEARQHISAADGNSRWLSFDTAGSQRWLVGADNVSESGSDVGSDFQIVRFSDDGTSSLGQPFAINRKTGVITLAQLPTSAAGLSTGDIWNNSGVLTVV